MSWQRKFDVVVLSGFVLTLGLGITIGTFNPRQPTPSQLAKAEIAAKFKCVPSYDGMSGEQ